MGKKSHKRRSGAQDSHVKMFPLLEHANGRGLMDAIPACSTISHGCLAALSRILSFSRTSRGFSLPTTEEISESFSAHWTNSGMAWRGECWTADFSASPSHAEGSTLLDVVETRPAQPQYYLSPNAAQGILRRADAQGRNLFPPLRRALETLASAQSSNDSDTAQLRHPAGIRAPTGAGPISCTRTRCAG